MRAQTRWSGYVLQGALHGGEKVAAALLLREFDELHKHLGVGLGAESVTLFLEHCPQGLVVLDDAVVHQREVAALAEVWVGVDGVGLAVGRPAGVGYADGARHIFGGTLVFEGLHFARGLVDVEIALGADHADAGRVVAAIFEPVETLDKNWVSLLLTDISYYSAHSVVFLI